MLSVSVSVECGLWTVDYDSAVSGEPPAHTGRYAMLCLWRVTLTPSGNRGDSDLAL